MANDHLIPGRVGATEEGGRTTFVLPRVFNLFNVRFQIGVSFNLAMATNIMLWVSLSCVVSLQIIAVHWL